MTELSAAERDVLIRREFRERAGIDVLKIEERTYPEETNVIVFVREDDLPSAAAIGNLLDAKLATPTEPVYVVVRRGSVEEGNPGASAPTRGVTDPRVIDMTRLITARSRVSIVQPSLSYVRDAQANLSAVTAARHQLVFGRRGAGKTALLVEARNQVREDGAISAWINMQTLRNEQRERVVLHVLVAILDELQSARQVVRSASVVASDIAELGSESRRMLNAQDVEDKTVLRLVPQVQRVLSRFLDIEGVPLFVFLDDFYYVARNDQPWILDALHGCVRDCDAWLKVASIRHLTRWFQSSPPVGLQTGHDADLIDLDVTLQDPGRAQKFLENLLSKYAQHVDISSLNRIFSKKALDRLVIASGAVPRDYLVLASSAIGKAKARPNASLVGAQDVNQAAGDAAGIKLQELEEDMASNVGIAEQTLAALRVVRDFCLEENGFTYFLVNFKDKELNPRAYSLLTELLDARLIHLLDAGVSDPHAAGERSEAFLLDLSQYSGSRLKRKIRVLDFSNGRMISRETGTTSAARVGNTPLQVIAILRAAPSFSLGGLASIGS
ncbi:hypothetical protein [Isoptericola sp. NPDC057191]|uniref:hypothetical protein n=1 Tax=Isoptericola sp. NPDC057191 TaxID=3346041 RepID=UPI00363475B3